MRHESIDSTVDFLIFLQLWAGKLFGDVYELKYDGFFRLHTDLLSFDHKALLKLKIVEIKLFLDKFLGIH